MDGNSTLPGWLSISSGDSNICYYFDAFHLKPGKPQFSLSGEIGTLFFHICETDPHDKENQVDVFPNGVSLTIDLSKIPDHIATHPEVLERGRNIIRLSYKHPVSGAWVPFQRQKVNGNILEVTFNFWHKDPGIGWGFI